MAATNSSELERTLGHLRQMGRLEEVDAARVQMLRSMAAQLDADPSSAAMWRQYREALRELVGGDSGGSLDVDVDRLFAEVGDPPPS